MDNTLKSAHLSYKQPSRNQSVLQKYYQTKLHKLYSSPNIIRVIKITEGEMDSICSRHEGDENGHKIFARKPEGKIFWETYPGINGMSTLKCILKEHEMIV
jgi:hypothetical protein